MYSFPDLESVCCSMFISNLLLDLHTDFSGGTSGGLVFLPLEEFSIVCCDIHSQGLTGAVNKAEVGIFLKLSCFFDDPMDVGNSIKISHHSESLET